MDVVNLIPIDCLDAQSRRTHMKMWLGVGLGMCALMACAGIHYLHTLHTARQLMTRLSEAQQTQADRAAQLSSAQADHDEIVTAAGALIGLRRTHPVPQRLLTLAQLTPEGVVLDQVRGVSMARGTDGTQPRSATVTGHALDHHELDSMMRAMQDTSEWRQVNLVRATREPYRAGVAVAFQLQCDPLEEVAP